MTVRPLSATSHWLHYSKQKRLNARSQFLSDELPLIGMTAPVQFNWQTQAAIDCWEEKIGDLGFKFAILDKAWWLNDCLVGSGEIVWQSKVDLWRGQWRKITYCQEIHDNGGNRGQVNKSALDKTIAMPLQLPASFPYKSLEVSEGYGSNPSQW